MTRVRRLVWAGWHGLALVRGATDARLAPANHAALPPNFISEIFFLCAQYLHIGPLHAIKEHKGMRQQVSHMTRQLADIEADTTWRGVRRSQPVAGPLARRCSD